MIKPRFNIRAKLLLVSLTLLAVPWVGLSFVKEVERALRLGHEQSVAATAQAVATALHDRPRLFEPQPGHASPWHETGDLYLFALPAAMEVDGTATDWPNTLTAHTYALAPASEYTPASKAAFKLRIGQHGAYVYALLEVTDALVQYRAAQNLWVEAADHIEFALTTPQGEFKRFAVSPMRPGTGAAYTLQFQDGKLALGEPDPRIQTVWRETTTGYNVELSMPQSLLGEKLAFAVADVSTPETGVTWISTSNVAQREGMGRLIVPSPEIQQVVQGLGRATSRIRVVDKSQRVIAEMGSLKQAQQALAPTDPPLLERIKAKTLRPIYARLLQQPTDTFRDDSAKASRLETREIESALRGVPQTGRRDTADGQAVIVSSAHPIWVQDQIIGAVVSEETTNSVLTLRNQVLEKLFTSVLAVFLIVALGMLLFASRLSYRIRKLSSEAEAAIDAQGRVVSSLKQSATATDEIGDLSRGFSNVLERLGQYNHYLENMASRLSHELRTPIAVVRSSLDNLAQHSVPDEARVYMERAQDGIRRLNTLLTRMTEARQLEQALQGAERETFDLIPVLAGCVEGYRGAYPGVEFNLRIPSTPIFLSGGPDLIAQMLDKLISNAVDFHHAHSSIDIALACDKQVAVLTISNEGPPLPAEMASQLFQSMVSVRARQAEDEPHLGFGLYIARLIAEYHGGSVRAENRKDGAGVVITITLPCATISLP